MGGGRNVGNFGTTGQGSLGLDKVFFDFQNFVSGAWINAFSPVEPEGPVNHDGEVIEAVHKFCQRCTAFNTKPKGSELEDIWHALAGRSTQTISAAIEEVFSFDATGALEWQPRFRALCILEYVKEQGGAAKVIGGNVVSENEEHIKFLAKEVPQCREIARRLLGWPTEPPPIAECAVPSKASSPASCEDKFDPNIAIAEHEPSDDSRVQASSPAHCTDSFNPNAVAQLEPTSSAPLNGAAIEALPADCHSNFDPDVAAHQEPSSASPAQMSPSEARTDCSESEAPGQVLQDVQRPYLWLSAVDFVEMEPCQEEFSDLGKDVILRL